MKISLNLRKEPTTVGNTTTTTFNAPGVYIPPYGKTVVTVGGRGASGNPTTPSTYAGTNPSSGGNYAGTNAGSGGNASTNPTTPGTYAGTNPTGYYWNQYVTLNSAGAGYTAYNTGYNTVTSNYPTINISGYFNAYGDARYDATGVKYTVGYATQMLSYSYNTSATYGTPPPYSAGGNYTNYAAKGVEPGGAYYNPPTPGNTYYNTYYPGNAYYNAVVPGNAYYNPVVPGTSGSSYTLGSVTLPGGTADSLAPEVSPTASTLVYNGPSGITITVPSGGYVTVVSKATNT